MDPTPSPHAPNLIAPDSQTACYLPWLKVSVALRYVLCFPWTPDAWREDIDANMIHGWPPLSAALTAGCSCGAAYATTSSGRPAASSHLV